MNLAAALINLVIYLLVLGVVFWLVQYMFNSIPSFAPFANVARVVLTVVACLILILLLLQFIGITPLNIPVYRY